MTRSITFGALGLLVLVAACGDRNDSPVAATPAVPPVVSNEVPATALASARAFSEFAASLMLDNVGAGLTLSAGRGPTSETDEPIAVR